jgi:hypothetical protein
MCKRTDWAVPIVAVQFVIYSDAFLPILMVFQFECGAISSSDEIRRSIAWEASELATAILLEKQNVLVLELNSLLGVILRAFYCVFTDP